MNLPLPRQFGAIAGRLVPAYWCSMQLDNLYFSCGAEMDATFLRTRAGGGEVVSVARVVGYRLAFFGHNPVWDGGVETLVAHEGSETWGVLYGLGAIEWERMDTAFGASLDGGGGHFHYPVEAELPGGERCQARTYRKAARGPAQPPSREYLAFLVECAVARGLPSSYVDGLRAHPATPARYPVPKPGVSARRHLHVL
jgi:hypothetical protein